jgi:uncharacterized membrane protein YdjX (TVP38/TMEM64 family)
MNPVFRSLRGLDAKAWRALAVSFILFGGVGLVFVLGAPLLGLKGAAAVERWMGAGLGGPAAPLAAVGGFTVLAFLGAPQFVLIAAAVLAFGPGLGFLYSWLGTFVSAMVGFYLGRRFGARILSQYAGDAVRQFTDMIGRNGFLASLLVRLVPSAPFIVVNMAAGFTPMKARAFAAGTALGIIPKIALTAFAGSAVLGALAGRGPGRFLGLALAAAVWIGVGLLTRAWMKRQGARRPGAPTVPSPGLGRVERSL